MVRHLFHIKPQAMELRSCFNAKEVSSRSKISILFLYLLVKNLSINFNIILIITTAVHHIFISSILYRLSENPGFLRQSILFIFKFIVHNFF